jgi:hypothetical protein
LPRDSSRKLISVKVESQKTSYKSSNKGLKPSEKCLLIKTWDGAGDHTDGIFYPIMKYTGRSFTTEESSFLFLTFDAGFTNLTGEPSDWEEGWDNDYEGTGNMDNCAVPINPNHDDRPLFSPGAIKFSISYRGKYWDGVSKDWVEKPTTFELLHDTLTKNKFRSIMNYPPPDDTPPLYESVDGYWLRFKNNSGTGTLTIELQTGYLPFYGKISFWLKNFNIRFIQATTAAQEFKQKQDTTYTNSSTSKFESPSITVNLSSSNESKASRSKLLRGESIIDTFHYVLPTGNATYAVVEKPEYHISRMITQYISRIKSIDDILDVDSFEWTKSYHGNKLWCNSLEYHILDDTIQCWYFYNDINYSPL